jgi:hypothetical protein
MRNINIQHWLNETKSGPAAPDLRLKVEKITEIIIYATSLSETQTGEPPTCRRRPKRKPCKGNLIINFEYPNRIHWICPACQDEGVVTGWEGLIWDMTDEPDNFQ